MCPVQFDEKTFAGWGRTPPGSKQSLPYMGLRTQTQRRIVFDEKDSRTPIEKAGNMVRPPSISGSPLSVGIVTKRPKRSVVSWRRDTSRTFCHEDSSTGTLRRMRGTDA